MARGRLYQLEGIVLMRRDRGEADRVVTLLTAGGRADLLALGVRKPRSRKSGHLELFSRTRLLVSKVQGSWDIISQAEVQVSRPRLQEDFQRGTYARYMGELVLRFFEDEVDPALFNLVDEALALLVKDDEPGKLTRWYEQHLLTLAGFRPEWRRCVGETSEDTCQSHLRPRPHERRPYGLDPELGGALCPDCFVRLRTEKRVYQLSPSALSWLQAFQSKPYADIADIRYPPATAKRLRALMEQYIAYHLEHRPTAMKLMSI